MSLESACLSALTVVVSALCYLWKQLWERSQACEKWRNEKEPLLRDMSEKLGALNGAMGIMRQCKTPNCMFTGVASAGETFSLKPLHPQESDP